MSKVKLLELDQYKKVLILNIKYYMSLNCVSHDELAQAAWVSSSTLFNRFRKCNFTIEELYYICRKLHIEITDLLKLKEVS